MGMKVAVLAIRSALTLLAAAVFSILLSAVAFTGAAFADSTDGERSYLAGRKDEAIRLFRRAAWQQNDFYAQIRLGEIYSAKRADDKGYEDRVEAFVWYFLAWRRRNAKRRRYTLPSCKTSAPTSGTGSSMFNRVWAASAKSGQACTTIPTSPNVMSRARY
jgi:hypothetical protein